MDRRRRARQLAAEGLASGDPTGWFEELYREALEGDAIVPWADLMPNPHLVEWSERQDPAVTESLVVGCGLGDDAEWLAGDTTSLWPAINVPTGEVGNPVPNASVYFSAGIGHSRDTNAVISDGNRSAASLHRARRKEACDGPG